MTEKKTIHVLSLGAGVQSSTLALMAAAGEIGPMPVAAVFADTMAEPEGVYRWLDWLEKQLPFPVIRATRGNLGADSTKLVTSKKTGRTYVKTRIPFYASDPETGKKGMSHRHCTRDYKILVIQREVRRLMKEHGAKKCLQWIGISTDEAVRMKPSAYAHSENIWPLIDAGISRSDCLAWMKAKGYPKPPRSACVFCPYHNDLEWKRLRDEEPEAFAEAVLYERRLSAAIKESTALNWDAAYLHADRVPLDRVVFRDDFVQPELFGNECEGICGV